MKLIKDIILHQKQRLARKGSISILFALLLNILFYYVLRFLYSIFTPQLKYYYENNYKILLVSLNFGLTSLCHIFNQLFYYLVSKSNYCKKFRVTNDQKKLIWQTNSQQWHQLKWRAIKFQIINLGILPIIVSSFLLTISPKLQIFKQLPSHSQFIKHLYICIVMQSITFFFLHLAAHKYFYGIHKIHHQFPAAHPLSTNHFHPLEYIFGIAIPFFSGPILIGGNNLHYFTQVIWTIWRIGQSYDNHCNYDFSWSIFRIWPFSASSQYHSFHHTHNIGIIGSNNVILDSIMGLNKQYYQYYQKKFKIQ